MCTPLLHIQNFVQRLEFLGDSVLDLLITEYLYHSHTDIDPGELTDLRSASVNNESFAQVAVRHGLHKHLEHCSPLLTNQISEYVQSFPESHDTTSSRPSINGPKVCSSIGLLLSFYSEAVIITDSVYTAWLLDLFPVYFMTHKIEVIIDHRDLHDIYTLQYLLFLRQALGDVVESIVGAILIDTNLSLDKVWKIVEPLLSPVVTPDKLELPPFRELNELCDSIGYFIKETCLKKGEMVHAKIQLQLNDILLVGEGFDRIRKVAKGKAASYLLKELEVCAYKACQDMEHE